MPSNLASDEVAIELPSINETQNMEQHGYLACPSDRDNNQAPPSYRAHGQDAFITSQYNAIQEGKHQRTPEKTAEALEEAQGQTEDCKLQGPSLFIKEHIDQEIQDLERQLAEKRQTVQELGQAEARAKYIFDVKSGGKAL